MRHSCAVSQRLVESIRSNQRQTMSYIITQTQAETIIFISQSLSESSRLRQSEATAIKQSDTLRHSEPVAFGQRQSEQFRDVQKQSNSVSNCQSGPDRNSQRQSK